MGAVERKVDTLKNAGKGTFKVCNLESVLQFLVFVMAKNMTPPKITDKYTTDIRQVQRGQILTHSIESHTCQN